MAIERITRVVCDKCKGTEGVESFQIKTPTKTTKLDLCKEDRKPLDEIVGLVAGAPNRRGGRKPKATA